ncbi:hypothetical protein PGT21_005518 [Puccinia graminis f. sp. tritici]|uniref:Uncharacterized protein n=1 Tax=Puccinia graminis f. sp. tritici TaxID=56615 RepID=A0A5B0QSK3_PUCGR|nr:hypothetical protein PGT21_005518 [Puccinia graminis f. sp. tritici]
MPGNHQIHRIGHANVQSWLASRTFGGSLREVHGTLGSPQPSGARGLCEAGNNSWGDALLCGVKNVQPNRFGLESWNSHFDWIKKRSGLRGLRLKYVPRKGLVDEPLVERECVTGATEV